MAVFQTVAAPVADVVHPEGNTGALMASKFCEKSGPRLPRTKLKLTVPRLAEPSCNCSVARPGVPHAPLADKLKDRLKAAPPPSAPYVCGPERGVTPPLDCNVATRLVVLPVPTLARPKLRVIVSPGSIAALVQLSAAIERLLETSKGTALVTTM